MEQNNYVYEETENPQDFVQNVEPIDVTPEIQSTAKSAFNKALASVILAWFPICSFIAIFLAGGALGTVKKVKAKAESYGIFAGGKNIAARILGIIGLVCSIIMTVFYFVYTLLLVGIIAAYA